VQLNTDICQNYASILITRAWLSVLTKAKKINIYAPTCKKRVILSRVLMSDIRHYWRCRLVSFSTSALFLSMDLRLWSHWFSGILLWKQSYMSRRYLVWPRKNSYSRRVGCLNWSISSQVMSRPVQAVSVHRLRFAPWSKNGSGRKRQEAVIR